MKAIKASITVALVAVRCPECKATARDIMPGGACPACGAPMEAAPPREPPPVTEFVEPKETDR